MQYLSVGRWPTVDPLSKKSKQDVACWNKVMSLHLDVLENRNWQGHKKGLCVLGNTWRKKLVLNWISKTDYEFKPSLKASALTCTLQGLIWSCSWFIPLKEEWSKIPWCYNAFFFFTYIVFFIINFLLGYIYYMVTIPISLILYIIYIVPIVSPP
jgi:hypothetical protein